MKQSQQIILVIIFITLCILFGTTLMDPKIGYGQSTGKMGLFREITRDPFALPSGIRFLSKEHTTSGTQEVSSAVSSRDISPSSLKVHAILISDHVRLASIDRHIVTVGDTIREEKILEIKNDRVILGKGDKKRTLLLSQSPVQLTVDGK